MATENKYRLRELGGSDYEIVDGQPDIRGWDVKDETGRKIGEVEELIFDPEARKVRYIVLDLEDNELDLDGRDVLVPIGLAQLHREEDDVILTQVTLDQLRSLPEYDEDRFDADFEHKVSSIFGRTTTDVPTMGTHISNDFYQHDHFNEDNLYTNRTTETGMEDRDRTRLRSRLETSEDALEPAEEHEMTVANETTDAELLRTGDNLDQEEDPDNTDDIRYRNRETRDRSGDRLRPETDPDL